MERKHTIVWKSEGRIAGEAKAFPIGISYYYSRVRIEYCL